MQQVVNITKVLQSLHANKISPQFQPQRSFLDIYHSGVLPSQIMTRPQLICSSVGDGSYKMILIVTAFI